VSLRDLVYAATPGPWKYHVEDLELTRDGDEPDPLVATRLIGEGISPEEGRLLALAPELAVLLADAMEYVDVIGAYLSSQSDPSPAVAQAEELLARFAALDARAGGEET
jgi:hypothetical protein